MLVSILIAVYNTEKYLTQCLDSLLLQSHTDWEAICVDDYSTDSSLQILKRYAEKDKRIKVIEQTENQGQAVARNKALQDAKGSVICFLDSDDWLASDALQKAITVFQENDKADSVLFRLVKVYPDGHEELYPTPSSTPSSLTGYEAFRLSLDWTIHGVYMIRAEIHKRFPYDDTSRSYSDDNTTRLHYLNSKEVHFCEGTYYYRQNPASVSNVKDISRLNFLRANEHMQQMLIEMNMDKDILNLHETVRHNNLIGCYLFYIANRSSWTKDDCIKAEQEMHRIWNTIDSQSLSSRKRFGYLHCASWTLFKLQEETFYFLRKLLARK